MNPKVSDDIESEKSVLYFFRAGDSKDRGNRIQSQQVKGEEGQQMTVVFGINS